MTVISACNESGLFDPSESGLISSTLPPPDAENVAIYTKISVGFSKPMDPSSINDTTFVVSRDSLPITGSISYEDSIATFTPSGRLPANSLIQVTLTSDVADLDGNAIGKDYIWSFQTGENPDSIAPEVSSTSPGNNDSNVPTDITVTAVFSEPINASTLSTASFYLTAGGRAVSGTAGYSGNTAFFNPDVALENNTSYSAIITTMVEDTAGNPMNSQYQWQFTTEKPLDTVPPLVVEVFPRHNEDEVDRDINISARFSEPMTNATISNETFRVYRLRKDRLQQISGTVSYSGTIATFNPLVSLREDSDYRAVITTGVADIAGNPMTANFTWDFETDKDKKGSDDEDD